MSEEHRPVSVVIMEKEYLVACNDQEREALFHSVEFLNRKMIELRDHGKVSGSERIAVMAALNIAHDLLEHKRQNEAYTDNVEAFMRRIEKKITDVLAGGERVLA